MKVAIIYNRLFELDGSTLSIGGIQTYLLRLCELIVDMGWEPMIFQLAQYDFQRDVGRVKITGKSGIALDSSADTIGRFLTKCAEEWINSANALIIFGTDTIFTESKTRAIAIQHGVTSDIPNMEAVYDLPNVARNLPHWCNGMFISLKKTFRESRLNMLRRTWITSGSHYSRTANKIQFLVCVDYNYYNALKAQGKTLNSRTWIIPNFVDMATIDEIADRRNDHESLRILFARRFIWYRGTRLIAPVFRRILQACPQVTITFAGEGPDENWLRDYFADCGRVVFIRYDQVESTKVLLSHDIAVVPSLGSEGTSLSAIEAMGAGCVVVASCVGGLTNLIIDDFNGKLVVPVEDEFYSVLLNVVNDGDQRKRLSENAYETVKGSFSLYIWRNRWHQVLMNVSQGASNSMLS